MLCNVTRSLNEMCPPFAAICLRIFTRRGSASTLATCANCFAGSRFFELFGFFVDIFFVRPSLHVCTLEHVHLSLDTLRSIRKRDFSGPVELFPAGPRRNAVSCRASQRAPISLSPVRCCA